MEIKTNKELNAFRGFTLIELLAVIVVLAIIILIAVQAVLPQMDKARRNALAIEANSAIQAAQAYFTAGDLMGGDTLPVGNNTDKCIKISDLIKSSFYNADIDKYEGSVQVLRKDGNFYYTVWIHNSEYQVIAKGSEDKKDGSTVNKDITLNDVQNYSGSWSDAYNNCGNISDDTSDETP